MKKFLTIVVLAFVACSAFACPGRPCPGQFHPCYGRIGASKDLCNAAAIVDIVASGLSILSHATVPVALANPVAPVVVNPEPVAVAPAPAPVATVHCPAGIYPVTAQGAMPVGGDILPAASIANPVATPVAVAEAVQTPLTPQQVNVTPVTTTAPATVVAPATCGRARRGRREQVTVSAPAPCVAPAVVAPYGRAGRVAFYGF